MRFRGDINEKFRSRFGTAYARTAPQSSRVPDHAKREGKTMFFRCHARYCLCLLLVVCGALSARPVIAQKSTDVVFLDQFENPACDDNIDADGDGFPGYPTDPGCTSLADNDEVDDCPSGPDCAQCANAIDDDVDTLVDYPDDPGCTAASDSSELNP
jgi:hypothetical protein